MPTFATSLSWKIHQGQGLGNWLMECIMAHKELRGLGKWSLVTRDAHGLYARFGFQPLADPGRYMEFAAPEELSNMV